MFEIPESYYLFSDDPDFDIKMAEAECKRCLIIRDYPLEPSELGEFYIDVYAIYPTERASEEEH